MLVASGGSDMIALTQLEEQLHPCPAQVQPSAPTPAAGTPEQVLAASIGAAGGVISIGKYREGGAEQGTIFPARTYPVLNAAGGEIATIKVKETLVTIALPDGSIVLAIQPTDKSSSPSFYGSAGDSFGVVEAKLPSAFRCELVADGQTVLTLYEKEQYWVYPFLLLTFCLGFFLQLQEMVHSSVKMEVPGLVDNLQ